MDEGLATPNMGSLPVNVLELWCRGRADWEVATPGCCTAAAEAAVEGSDDTPVGVLLPLRKSGSHARSGPVRKPASGRLRGGKGGSETAPLNDKVSSVLYIELGPAAEPPR